MPLTSLIILIILFFITSVIGVVTGSNSLITVPVMFQFGIDEKVAIATNMFGLTFMAIGGTIPFVQKGVIDFRKISPLVFLTVIGSAIGALLLGSITNQTINLIVLVSMIAVAIFILFKHNLGIKSSPSYTTPSAPQPPLLKQEGSAVAGFSSPTGLRRGADASSAGWSADGVILSRTFPMLTFIFTFLLGIYGGLYSGGYVTILTAVYVAFFGMTFTESVASTKFINVFSSSIATAVFMWQGLVDYKLGIILAVTMFTGAYLGAQFVTKLNDIWIKRIFLTTVFVLAIKTLYDFMSD